VSDEQRRQTGAGDRHVDGYKVGSPLTVRVRIEVRGHLKEIKRKRDQEALEDKPPDLPSEEPQERDDVLDIPQTESNDGWRA
jgi:hypothetical protein